MEKGIVHRLNELPHKDPEGAHVEADELLLEALNIAGMSNVVDAYISARNRIGFWYA